MQVQLNNLINNTKISLFINSKDTVIDIKQSIAFSFPPNNKINASNLRLSYLDPKTNHIISMLSPYRTILSYPGRKCQDSAIIRSDSARQRGAEGDII